MPPPSEPAPPAPPASEPDVEAQIEAFADRFNAMQRAIGQRFVGHDELVRLVLACLVAGGHVLIEGVPGLGKTLLIRTLSEVVDLRFSRIQFTPDLMPSDITGTHAVYEKPGGGIELRVEPGPLVANLVLADEINRATPKTQAALLQAMQEKQVSLGNTTLDMPDPFLVMATQNPVEQEGTYPLPEAQLDRFLVKLQVDYPQEAEYATILRQTTGHAVAACEAVCDAPTLCAMRQTARGVAVSDQVLGYVTRVVMATQPGSRHAGAAVERHVRMGASPRAAQALLLLGKVMALLDGRPSVAAEDVRRVALPVLRHRLLMKFEAQAEGVTADAVLEEMMAGVSEATADA